MATFVPPATINGIDVTATFSGSVHVFPDEYTSCSSYTTPSNGIWLGQMGSFAYTFHFSQQVSDVTLVIAAAGQNLNENFICTINTGTVSITDLSSCFSTVSGNVILSGVDATTESGGGGGLFRIAGSVPFTSLTITGNGGSAGSLVALCTSFNTVIPSPCAPFVDLDAVVLPNVLTANGDLVNDEFLFPSGYGECYDYEVQLMNRWGELVYSFSNTTKPFSGSDQDGNQLENGVYFYVVKSNHQQKTGFVTLIR